jgi:hypothetical protein
MRLGVTMVVFTLTMAVQGGGPVRWDLRVMSDASSIQGTWKIVGFRSFGRNRTTLCNDGSVWQFGRGCLTFPGAAPDLDRSDYSSPGLRGANSRRSRSRKSGKQLKTPDPTTAPDMPDPIRYDA